MTGTPPTAPPPGWYPDPAGSSQNRWWTGSSWGDLQPYQPMQSHAAYSPFGGAQPYGSENPAYGQQYSYYGQGLRAPAGTDPSTTQIWLIAFWPLLNLIGVVMNAVSGAYDLNTNYYSSPFTALDGLQLIIGALLWAGFILLAYSDYSELKRRSVPQPFHWAFAFIPFIPLVYVIGRSVVAYSRTGRGLAPLWVYIVAGLAAMFGGTIGVFSAYLSH